LIFLSPILLSADPSAALLLLVTLSSTVYKVYFLSFFLFLDKKKTNRQANKQTNKTKKKDGGLDSFI